MGEYFEKVCQFADAITSMGVCVVRKSDDTLLYCNEKMKKMQSEMGVGCNVTDYITWKSASGKNLTISEQVGEIGIGHLEGWDELVQLSVDEYLWNDAIPAYLVLVTPKIISKEMQESILYNRMMDRAALTICESLGCCNFTKGTYTGYTKNNAQSSPIGITENVLARYAKFLEELHPDDRKDFSKNFSIENIRKQIDNGQKEMYGEYRKIKAGRYQWISFRCMPFSNPFDNDALCLVVIRNIHLRKQMERQLSIQLNATYQAVPGGVVILQIDNKMSIINASQSFYDMLGKSVKDYENGYIEHIVAEDREDILSKVTSVSKHGAPFDIVYRELDMDNKIHWMRARGTRISEEDDYPVYLAIRMDVTDLKEAQQQLIEEQKNYKIYTEGIIDTLSNLVEFRDIDSGQHIKRTKNLTRILLQKLREKNPQMELSDESIDKVSEAAALHDVGKIAISDTILNKPGKLTNDEYERMKEHTVKGYEILKTLNLAQDEEQRRYCLDISRYHHERWDGKGYPDHLKGDEIPIWSQVVSIVDVYDALVSQRVYKKAYSHKKAMQMILNGECGTFNPVLLECLKGSVDLLEREYGSEKDKVVETV